jgi:hypothetical protein
MKECKECKRKEVIFWSKKHLTCIECIKKDTIRCRKDRVKNDFKSLIKKKRSDCTTFILSKNSDYSYHNDLGCNYKKIRKHIEKQFQPGMSWQSHGGWHIDHIIPLSKAKTESELYKLLKWKNIQPLWAEANLRKKNGKIDNSKLKEINEKMALRYEIAQNNFESGIIKTKTIKQMFELLSDFGIVTMNELIIYARSIGYEREGDLFIKRRKL